MGLFGKKAPEKTPAPEYIEVGQIVNTHGVRGEVKVQPWDVDAARLCAFRTFYLDEKPVRPTSKRRQGEMVLMQLPEVEDMTAAEALKWKVLSVKRSDVVLPKGEYFDAEIVGMQVFDDFFRHYLGTVDEVQSYPAHKLYHVSGGEKNYLIPAVEGIFITKCDTAAREIYVHLIEGLETDEN